MFRHRLISPCCALTAALPFFLVLPSRAAFHQWQIQQVCTNSDGSVQFIEMHDNFQFETFTNGLQLSATSDGNTKTVTLTNLPSPTPGSLLFATSGFSSLPGAVTPDFTLPSGGPFFNPNATSITISFSGSGDSITFSGASLPHDGVHSLTDTNLYSTPNLVSGVNALQNLVGATGSVSLAPEPLAAVLFVMALPPLAWHRRRRS